MGSWWRRVGDWLSRRTVATLVAVLAVTGLFAVGLGALDFATGQDSYIDPESQVAKDNGAYQELFGGENMVVLFTVPEGKTVVDLFTSGNVAQMNEVQSTLEGNPAITSVISPVALLQWSSDLIAKGVASEIVARAIDREPTDTGKAARHGCRHHHHAARRRR